jgi:cytochrome c biogenesis protein CcdA
MDRIWILIVVTGLSWLVVSGAAAPASPVCAWYFTGVGCSNCAQVDPLVLGDWLATHPDLVVIEYEIYEEGANAPVYDRFVEQHALEYGIPLFFISPGQVMRGVRAITAEGPTVLNGTFSQSDGAGGIMHLESCRISGLEGSPKIWCGDRILIRSGVGGDDGLLRQVLVAEDIGAALEGEAYAPCEPCDVQRSGTVVAFDHAVRLEGWTFQWRGAGLDDPGSPALPAAPGESCASNATAPPSHNLPKIVALACVDALNPCALAVLVLVLTSIMASGAGTHRRVLWAGIAFSAAVFVMYLIYGLIIVSLFSFAGSVAGVRDEAGLILGAFAILLGLAQVYDARAAGSVNAVTGMPEGFRRRVRLLVSSISSVPGAFLIGALVTVFLLPCTIGPYIIAGGMLSPMGMFATLPYLLLYNAVFVLPMLALTVAIGLGMGRPGAVNEWRRRNLRAIHVLAGVIMLIIGAGLVLGVF